MNQSNKHFNEMFIMIIVDKERMFISFIEQYKFLFKLIRYFIQTFTEKNLLKKTFISKQEKNILRQKQPIIMKEVLFL